MTKTLGPNQKFFVWLLGLTGLCALFFATNIYGYYRFQAICAKEGGLRVYAPIERGFVHEGDELSVGFAASFAGVLSARTQSKKTGEWVDEKLIAGVGGKPNARYEVFPADKLQVPRYKWAWTNRMIENELRLYRTAIEITDLQSGKLAVGYYRFSYHFFNPNTVLLGAGPRGQACPELTAGDDRRDAIQSSFSRQ